MKTISASAESARETARQDDGRFGAHAAEESAATLHAATLDTSDSMSECERIEKITHEVQLEAVPSPSPHRAGTEIEAADVIASDVDARFEDTYGYPLEAEQRLTVEAETEDWLSELARVDEGEGSQLMRSHKGYTVPSAIIEPLPGRPSDAGDLVEDIADDTPVEIELYQDKRGNQSETPRTVSGRFSADHGARLELLIPDKGGRAPDIGTIDLGPGATVRRDTEDGRDGWTIDNAYGSDEFGDSVRAAIYPRRLNTYPSAPRPMTDAEGRVSPYDVTDEYMGENHAYETAVVREVHDTDGTRLGRISQDNFGMWTPEAPDEEGDSELIGEDAEDPQAAANVVYASAGGYRSWTKPTAENVALF